MSKWKWFVYIILCKDDTYYTGLTYNISIRHNQHKLSKGSRYTKLHGFKRLVYYEEHDDLEVARNRERQIKKWNQEKKEKLINGNWKKEW